MLGFRKLVVWIFGEDGDILTHSETQALVIASGVLVTGSMLLSPLIADLAPIYGVSETRSGWLIISFTAAAAVTLPVVGALSDRIGRRTIMTGGLLAFGVSGAAVGFVTVFELALVLRAIQGVAYASAAPIILVLFGDMYSGSRETTAQGMRVTANSLLNTAAPLLAGLLFVYSWRYPFVIYLTAIPMAAWIWLTVPETSPSNDWSFEEYLFKMMGFLRSLPIALLMFSFLLRFILFYGLITYVSVLGRQAIGLTVVAISVLLSIRGLLATLSSTQVGRFALSYDPAVLSLVSYSVLALGVTLMGALPTVETLAVGIVLAGIGDGILSPSQKSLANRMSHPSYRGGMMSTALTFQNLGKVVGPALLGIVIGIVGPAPAFTGLGIIVGGIGTITLFCVVASRRLEAEPER